MMALRRMTSLICPKSLPLHVGQKLSQRNQCIYLNNIKTDKLKLRSSSRSIFISSSDRNFEGESSKGFAQAFDEQEDLKHKLNVIQSRTQQSERTVMKENQSFASMLRNSPFIGLGDFKNRKLVGKIVEKAEDSLFIDFGGKFLCVCKTPSEVPEKYHCGAMVEITLSEWEISARFLGATKDVTLLEAEATINQLYMSKKK